MSTAPFKAGDKVTVIDNRAHLISTAMPGLLRDTVYCVESCYTFGNGRYWLVRVVGDPMVINHVNGLPHGWGSHRFRRIWTQTTTVTTSIEQPADIPSLP